MKSALTQQPCSSMPSVLKIARLITNPWDHHREVTPQKDSPWHTEVQNTGSEMAVPPKPESVSHRENQAQRGSLQGWAQPPIKAGVELVAS